MIEIPKELQRLVIKEKFLLRKNVLKEIAKLETSKSIENLFYKIDRLADVFFTDDDPEIEISRYRFSIAWFGSVDIDSNFVKVELVWEIDDDKITNYILSTNEDGEEGVLKEL